MVTVKLTPEQFKEKKDELAKSQGIVLSGNSGQATKDGIAIGYNYDGENLVATVVHHPFFVPVGAIEDHLKQWLGAQ